MSKDGTFKPIKNITERGLCHDKGDASGFKNPRCKVKNRKSNGSHYVGMTYEREFYQPMPFFWTREGNTANSLLGHYRGSVGFLICGGPSFKEIDKDKLKYCWTMSVNNSPKSYRPDAWVSVDDPSRFLRSIWLDPKIMKFQPFGMPEKRLWDNQNGCPLGLSPGDCPNVFYFKRNSKFHAQRWLWEDTINWGNAEDYGGGRSVMLVALRIMFLLGFRTVYLLGVDFDMSKDKTYHFKEKRTKGAVNCNRNTYKRMNDEYFPQLRPHFEKAGFDVFNCNPNSNLTAFDFVSFDDAVDHAMAYPGDIENEPTEGLYDKPQKKFKEYEEMKAKEKKQTDNEKKA